jgi:hypothetical protein
VRMAASVSAAGYRAEGGPVSRGQPYVVGERGPELFVPRGAGNIIPNKAGMGGRNSARPCSRFSPGSGKTARRKLCKIQT